MARPAALLLGAAAYETVRSFKAEELLQPAQLKGPHHQVASAVPTEGYLHVFTLTTDWGAVEAEGLSLLKVRLDEVRALTELDGVSKSKVFLESAGGSVLKVGKSVGAVVKDPEATAKGMGAGVKRFGTNLGRKAKRTGDKAVDAAKSDGRRQGQGGRAPRPRTRPPRPPAASPTRRWVSTRRRASGRRRSAPTRTPATRC